VNSQEVQGYSLRMELVQEKMSEFEEKKEEEGVMQNLGAEMAKKATSGKL